MQDDQPEQIQGDMNELNRRISVAWDALQDVIRGLDERQLTDLRDANGWAIKDHLMNLVLWERSIAVFLEGQPRHSGLGLTEQEYADLDADGMNAILFERYRDLPAAEVLERLNAQHRETLDVLSRLTWEDVTRPYAEYYAGEPTEEMRNPVLYWIMGNTAGHYDEHREWIEALLR